MSTSNKGTSLVLRACLPGGYSYQGFKWPLVIGAKVAAPDWVEDNNCGRGLHGWLEGQGEISVSEYSLEPNAVWLVLRVNTASIIHLGGKCKFPRATVVFVGELPAAAEYIHEQTGKPVIGQELSVGANQVAVVGALGKVTADNWSTAIAGDNGIAKAQTGGCSLTGMHGTSVTGIEGISITEERGAATTGGNGIAITRYAGSASGGLDSIVVAGNRGFATSESRGLAVVGEHGRASVGAQGTAVGGFSSVAIAGLEGIAVAGPYGTAKAGDGGLAIARHTGAAAAGEHGCIIIKSATRANAFVVGFIGQNGLLPNTTYMLNAYDEFVAP